MTHLCLGQSHMHQATLLCLIIGIFPAPASAAQGVNADTITLGMTSAFTGRSAGLGSELFRGAQAAFQTANQAGGIHGRKIRLIAYDDGYEPAQAVSNTLTLVERDQVFALFGNVGTPTTVKVLPLLLKYRSLPMLMFAPFTGAQMVREEPYLNTVVNVRASYRDETAALVNLFVDLGKRQVAVFYQNDSYGRSGYDGVIRALKPHGLRVVAEANYPRGAAYATSMAPQVRALGEASFDAVVAVGAYQACAAMVRDLRRNGFAGPIGNVSFVGSEALLELLTDAEVKDARIYSHDLYNSEVVPSPEMTELPLVAAYRRDLAAVAPEIPKQLLDPSYVRKPFSFVSLEGYVNATVLMHVLKNAGKELNEKSFAGALAHSSNADFGLGATFQLGDPTGHHQVWIVKADNQRWVPVIR